MLKSTLVLLAIAFTFLTFGQVPDKFNYPDTLWVEGMAIDSTYGFSPENAIKVGGGVFPKHIYTYLNGLTDLNGNKISYKRIGSCCSGESIPGKSLITFFVTLQNKEYQVYFDGYQWEQPKLMNGFAWKESRSGYHGEFKNDTIFQGHGIYFFDDGGYYKGNWENGMMNGQGELLIADTEKYVGEFLDGEYHGNGTLFYKDGGKYVGEWKEGLRNGQAKIYYPPGSEIEYMEGIYKNGSPVGTFQVAYSDGTSKQHKF